jgi:hypothetical protein
VDAELAELLAQGDGALDRGDWAAARARFVGYILAKLGLATRAEAAAYAARHPAGR